MVNQFEQLLLKYWGFIHFRPLQLDIIESVYNGTDTLALLATGGGKSLTFQITGLAKSGVCIVVTPLIALMKDQVDALLSKQIKAVAVYSGMTFDEIKIAYDKCVWGEYKFLYVSPERLKTEHFQAMVKNMNVNLIAVDEAHCVSRWGYDFRPAYLEIIKIRELLPKVPVLALTATATPKVIDDIMDKLGFTSKTVYTSSFERKNLTYLVREKDDKIGYMLSIATKVKGVGIVYVRNRAKTREIALLLKHHGFNADFYHAGLTPQERTDKQNAWKKSHDMVMVCTNAFGMGIDKADVRFVVHLDLPESPEDYFQEAGRAGRDDKPAFAVLLYNNGDVERLRQSVITSFPEIDSIKKVYESLAFYFEIPVGTNNGNTFEFIISDFCQKFKIDLLLAHNAIKVLEQEGFITLSEAMEMQSKLKFVVSSEDVYKFQVSNAAFDPFLKLLLRTYSGLFTDITKIDEYRLALLGKVDVEVVKKYLVYLEKSGIISYFPARKNPLIMYMTDRIDTDRLQINKKEYDARKQRYVDRIEAMIHYAQTNAKCRSLILLEYFGEKNATRCGNCDVCRKRNEMRLNNYTFDAILNEVKTLLHERPLKLEVLMSLLSQSEEQSIKVIQFLLDNKKIEKADDGLISWHH